MSIAYSLPGIKSLLESRSKDPQQADLEAQVARNKAIREQMAATQANPEDAIIPQANQEAELTPQAPAPVLPEASQLASSPKPSPASPDMPDMPELSADLPGTPVEPSPLSSIMSKLPSKLQQAQDERREKQGLSKFARIGETLRAGLGGAGRGAKYDPNFDLANAIAKGGELGVQEVKEDQILGEQEKMQDPKSEISKQYRKLANELSKAEIPETISAAQLAKQLPMLQQLASVKLKKQALDLEEKKLKESGDGMSKFEQDIQKIMLKDDLKDKSATKKENRKLRADLNEGQRSLESQLDLLQNAKKEFEKFSKKTTFGTGPFATVGGLSKYTDAHTQKLEAMLRKVSLDSMVKMFAGMSKAVDSDAERRAFEATQPSLTNDDEVNRMVLENAINATKSLLNKTKKAKTAFDKTGSFQPEEVLAQTQPGQDNNQNNEVRRKTKDGQIAIFDADTKEFLRYE
jgi:hypothetical protein